MKFRKLIDRGETMQLINFSEGRFRLGAVALVAICASLLGVQSASAQTCIQDVWKAHGNNQNLTCSANDVRIAFADNIKDLQGNSLSRCISGSTFSFIADFHVNLTADTRYDIGLYFATDGDSNHNGAITGACSANVITAKDPQTGLGSANFVQLDAAPDTCGDINSTHNPQVVTVRVDNVLCQDSDGDGKLNLPNCTTWRQPGSNEVCQVVNDAYPGSPSKCNCDIGFNVPIIVETGTINVTKDVTNPANATLPEPGGEFTYRVGVTSQASFTNVILDRICDDQYGLVAKVVSAPNCPAGSLGTINSTTCVLPQTLTPGSSYSCTFKATASTSVTDTVTVFGHDSSNNPVQGSDSAQVFVSDVLPTASVVKSLNSLQCAIVRYGVRVNNLDPVESLNLSALSDNGFGDITTVHGDVVATTCSVPRSIAVTGNYTCTFDAKFCGSSHTDKVTGTLNDNDGNTINQDSNSLTVNVSAQ